MTGKVRDDFLQLVKAFPITSIKDDKHLREAQHVIDGLLTKPKLRKAELEYFSTLGDLVRLYEDAHHAIGAPSDADLLRHLMEARGITQSELHQGTKIATSTISEILSGKRTFTKDMIGKLAIYFGVEKGVFAGNF